jgi:DNA-binding NarL/FixJ family response regulator
MIVDDSDMIRERLARRLEAVKGVRITAQADDIAQAIEAFDTHKPQAVILDISMPGGNGIDVLEYIKRTCPGSIVIMLTNYALQQLRDRCMQHGADFFFDKSSEFDRAIAVLRSLAENACCPPQQSLACNE